MPGNSPPRNDPLATTAGAILHGNRSCEPHSIGQTDLKERLVSEAMEHLG